MPLPTALAAKLAKRGLIKAKSRADTKTLLSSKGYEGCPNKYNVYHECTKYCITRWKAGVLEPDAKYIKKRERLLKKYPLPSNWKEVYDRGTGRYYYWDTEKDLVAWLPPGCPKCEPMRSAAHIREERLHYIDDKPEEPEKPQPQPQPKPQSTPEKKPAEKPSKKVSKNNDLDPMDPAAYSDIPRGTWASGLESAREKQTVEVATTGPVYHIKSFLTSNKHSE